MIRINLLAAERKPASKAAAAAPGVMQAYVIIGALAGLAIVGSGVLYFLKDAEIQDLDKKIKSEQETKTRLQGIKKQVDDLKAKQANLEQKMKVLSGLKEQKGASVHMLDELSKSLPDFVWLSSLDQGPNGLSLAGESASMTAVADFMTNLQRSGWFQAVELGQVTENNNIVAFTLTTKFQPPAPSPAPDAAPAPAAPAGR